MKRSPQAWCVSLAFASAIAFADERTPLPTQVAGPYSLGEDSLPHDAVPRGRLEGPFEFKSTVFAGTVRRYWVFVPAQYREGSAANLLVFQDGQRATAPKGALRVPQVLENLIHKGDIPVTIGLFVTPGNLSDHYPDNLGMANPDHRAEEYDSLDDAYARMLIDELLPKIAATYTISTDPGRRAIGGTSSGAICAFTVAWHRPDQFRNVISMIGSFTSIAYRPATSGQGMIPGGDLYPTLIRKNTIRPLRVFLQDGEKDLSNEHGNWFLANEQMLSAFEYANRAADKAATAGPRYDIAHQWGDGSHSDDHGGAILPDILRWIWRDS